MESESNNKFLKLIVAPVSKVGIKDASAKVFNSLAGVKLLLTLHLALDAYQ